MAVKSLIMEPKETYLRVGAVADEMEITCGLLLGWVESGRLTGVRVDGGEVAFVPRNELAALLDSLGMQERVELVRSLTGQDLDARAIELATQKREMLRKAEAKRLHDARESIPGIMREWFRAAHGYLPANDVELADWCRSGAERLARGRF